jgi:hypothetical protein
MPERAMEGANGRGRAGQCDAQAVAAMRRAAGIATLDLDNAPAGRPRRRRRFRKEIRTMFKAALLLIAALLLALIAWPVVEDPFIIAVFAGLLFVVLAPLVFDRVQSPKPLARRVRRFR